MPLSISRDQMGPILIFDKSFLQSLNMDEAVWLDNFFLTNITPLFFVETLADLEKEVGRGKAPEAVVGNIAMKTPDLSVKPNVHHRELLAAELSGVAEIDMKYGRPIVSGGRAVELDGKTGVYFDPSPEEEALSRWQKGDFLDLERQIAKKWRLMLSGINLQQYHKDFQKFFPCGKPKSLSDVKKFVDFHLEVPHQESVLKFGLALVGVPEEAHVRVLDVWRSRNKQPIRTVFPYFAHVFSVDLFFAIAIAADLISRGRPSHKIDVAYLYYLPFCMAFTSSDKLHAQLAPFFLKPEQTFISGPDLKADLANLDVHYSALPDSVKMQGLVRFAFYPPRTGTFLVSSLWDKHMAKDWRERAEVEKPSPDKEAGKEILAELKKWENEAKPVADNVHVGVDSSDHVVVRRMVHAKKGKWMRFPPEVINRKKNMNGEWEDVRPGS